MTVGTQTAATDMQPSYLTGKGGVGAWFTTTDHKKIGMMFLGWTLLAFLLGAVYALFPVIKSLGGRGLEGRFIFQATTYHRLLLTFLFVVPAVPAVLGHFLLPLQLGASNLALPHLSRCSLRFYVIGLLLIIASMFVGPVATNWTMSWAVYETGEFGLVAAGLILVAVSWFLTGVNFLVTIHIRRAKGMGYFDMPVMAWAMYLTAYMLVAVGLFFGIVVGNLAMTWCSGTGMFADRPELWQRYFWFFATPGVFFSLLPAVGVIFEIVAGISRRAVVGYRMVVGSMIALLGFSFLAGGVYLSGQDPTTTMVYSLLSIFAVIPVSMLAYSLLATLSQGAIDGNGPDTFVIGFLLHGAIVCLMGLVLASPALGSYLGSSMFFTTQLDYVTWGSALFALLAGLHYWWPKMIGRDYNRGVARIGGVFTIVGLNLALIPRMVMGTQGVSQDMIAFLQSPTQLAEISGLGWLLVYGGILVVVGNLYASTWNGARAVANPWGAATLEWKTLAPPPEENFELQPEVDGLYRY